MQYPSIEFLVFTLTLLAFIFVISPSTWRTTNRPFFARHRTQAQPEQSTPYARTKPPWVINEVLRLKALLGTSAGCRSVAFTFNRLHGTQITVGKTFVSNVIKNHQYELLVMTRDLRTKKPLPVDINAVWGMDITFIKPDHGDPTPCLGIVDHGSRVCVRLAALENKKSLTILHQLRLAISIYGKPKAIRTDNEIIFNSFVFRAFLKWAGIDKQTIPIACPWFNGRIERMFGTLKSATKQLTISNLLGLHTALNEWQLFYNHVRPHQNLGGLTPFEVWQGLTPLDIKQMPIESATAVTALDGVVGGYYLRR
jgi:putative transposase